MPAYARQSFNPFGARTYKDPMTLPPAGIAPRNPRITGALQAEADLLRNPNQLQSPMPGIVRRNNVISVVGQPTSGPALDRAHRERMASARLAAARRAATANWQPTIGGTLRDRSYVQPTSQAASPVEPPNGITLTRAPVASPNADPAAAALAAFEQRRAIESDPAQAALDALEARRTREARLQPIPGTGRKASQRAIVMDYLANEGADAGGDADKFAAYQQRLAERRKAALAKRESRAPYLAAGMRPSQIAFDGTEVDRLGTLAAMDRTGRAAMAQEMLQRQDQAARDARRTARAEGQRADRQLELEDARLGLDRERLTYDRDLATEAREARVAADQRDHDFRMKHLEIEKQRAAVAGDTAALQKLAAQEQLETARYNRELAKKQEDPLYKATQRAYEMGYGSLEEYQGAQRLERRANALDVMGGPTDEIAQTLDAVFDSGVSPESQGFTRSDIRRMYDDRFGSYFGESPSIPSDVTEGELDRHIQMLEYIDDAKAKRQLPALLKMKEEMQQRGRDPLGVRHMRQANQGASLLAPTAGGALPINIGF